MTILVNDYGFSPDDWSDGYVLYGDAANDVAALDLPADVAVSDIVLTPALRMIRVRFDSFSDGRGFTLGRQLRLRGYTGRLRAQGHILADQYAMVRRAGFDEVEIGSDLAARQPENQWIFRADWRNHDYQARLRG